MALSPPLLLALVLCGNPRRPDGGVSADRSIERRAAEERCVDRWLTEHRLDRYGSPEGTVYLGGSPLFDERTGRTEDRLAHVYRRRAEAKQACHPP